MIYILSIRKSHENINKPNNFAYAFEIQAQVKLLFLHIDSCEQELEYTELELRRYAASSGFITYRFIVTPLSYSIKINTFDSVFTMRVTFRSPIMGNWMFFFKYSNLILVKIGKKTRK